MILRARTAATSLWHHSCSAANAGLSKWRVAESGIAAMTAVLALATFPAFAYDPSVDRAALDAGLQKYSSCTSECAKELGLQIVNESVDVGLKTVGAIKANESAPAAVK